VVVDSAQRAILMTDLEGSTAHLRALGDEYASVLAQHHGIIRAALAAERGVEVGSEGDSFAAVVPGTAGALRAAVAIQRGLFEAEWPDSPWRVRIAIHAGSVEMGVGGAVGMSLHQAARIRAIVHGGQIVMSDTARRSIAEPVPAEIVMTDLGPHTVRDFDSPARLHQVSAPGLPSDFPQLRTMAARDVPTAGTRFVGREEELDALLEVLSGARLVTISGAGGSGKTRLAYEVARRAEIDTVVVVELAGLRDASQVDAEVARVVGARQPEEIAAVIGARDLLLVVDNCEHVMPRIALLVSELLRACEGLVVLATSRAPLAIAGEAVWRTPELSAVDAIELFTARAASRSHDEQLVRIACERLGYMPLAIELAAARARSVPLQDLVHRLDDQLRLLTTGSRDVPRQQTLRATLDWSHDLLTADERTVLRRLAVFAGGFTLNAAEVVAPHPSDVDVLDALDGLVSQSLVELSPDTDRYRMLEPVRQYAIDRLRNAGEDELVYERHTRWAATLGAEANRMLFTDERRRWTAVLDSERENLGAAIRWSLDHDRAPIAASLASSLAWYWFTSARSEALVWIPRVVATLDALEPKDRAKVLLAAGITYCDFRVDERPTQWLTEAVAIYRSLDRPSQLGWSLFWLGRVAAMREEPELAERVFTEAASVFDRVGDLFGWGWSRVWRGQVARQRDLDLDEHIQHEVLARCDGVPHVVGAAWGELSHVADERGDTEGAMAYVSRALEIFRDLGDRYQILACVAPRARYAMGVSLDLSAACAIAALQTHREFWAQEAGWAPELVIAAVLLHRAGRLDEAVVVAGAVEEQLFRPPVSRWPYPVRELLDNLVSLLNQPSSAVPLERGRRLGVRGAVDAAVGWLERAYPASTSITT
jgi:predicted ATPase